MLRTSTASISLDGRGVVITKVDAGVAQSVEDARQNLAATVELSAGVRRPLLVDISRCRPLEPEVRHLYSGTILVESFSALALLIEASPFGRMMGNIYLRIARPGIPTKLFTDEDAALSWLGEHRG